ncbi:hypothetical protein [Bordetella hinzii]|uniref:hypothetical protein n=1 Tax=Bordetella hinzii TaxID=103855 RepID=UPI0039FBC89C
MTYETENLATAIAKLAEKITDPDALRLLGEVKRLAAPGARPAAGDALDAKRYRELRRKVCIVGSQFHILNLGPTYIAPDAAVELDSVLDAAIAAQRKGDA